MNLSFDITTYRNVPPRDRILFYHIPKCAGTSMRWHLKRVGVETHDTVPHPISQTVAEWSYPFYTQVNRAMPELSLGLGPAEHPDRFNNALKLSTVRNPFAWLVSLYTHSDNEEQGWANLNYVHGVRSFEEFVDRFTDPLFPWGSTPWHQLIRQVQVGQWFTGSGKCEVDLAVRAERLNEGADHILHGTGLMPLRNSVSNHTVPEGWINASRRRSKIDYKEWYTGETRAKAEEYFSDVMEIFGYDFNGTTDDRSVIDVRELDLLWRFHGTARPDPSAPIPSLVSQSRTGG